MKQGNTTIEIALKETESTCTTVINSPKVQTISQLYSQEMESTIDHFTPHYWPTTLPHLCQGH